MFFVSTSSSSSTYRAHSNCYCNICHNQTDHIATNCPYFSCVRCRCKFPNHEAACPSRLVSGALWTCNSTGVTTSDTSLINSLSPVVTTTTPAFIHAVPSGISIGMPTPPGVVHGTPVVYGTPAGVHIGVPGSPYGVPSGTPVVYTSRSKGGAIVGYGIF
jgi:hypothetical protein